MTRISSSILCALLVGIVLNTHAVAAQDPEQIPNCASIDGFSRLDFWLGEWQVESGGQVVGSNRIVKVQAGCAIEEHWTDAEGGTGQSLFYYLPAVDEWHQVWVTPNAAAAGGVKQKKLIEEFEDGGVRFQGTITRQDGTIYLDRTTLRPLPDGTVSQHIQLSADDGETWSEGWSGIYHRIYSAEPRGGG
jgi:hypothetical protein